MQVNNNYQPTFKSGHVTEAAKYALRRRLLSKSAADAFVKKFEETFSDSRFKLTMGTVSNRRKELDVMIQYENPKDEYLINDLGELYKHKFFRMEEEGWISSIFKSPYRFLERIKKIYDKTAIPFAENGYKHIG